MLNKSRSKALYILLSIIIRCGGAYHYTKPETTPVATREQRRPSSRMLGLGFHEREPMTTYDAPTKERTATNTCPHVVRQFDERGKAYCGVCGRDLRGIHA